MSGELPLRPFCGLRLMTSSRASVTLTGVPEASFPTLGPEMPVFQFSLWASVDEFAGFDFDHIPQEGFAGPPFDMTHSTAGQSG